MAFGSQLKAFLGLDTAGFKAGLLGVESALNKFAGKLGLGLSVAGLAGYTRSVIEYGDKIQDLGDRFGVSTVALQKFGNAAEKNGSSLEGVAQGFNKLEISRSKALAGNSLLVQSFKNMGVSVEDLQTLSPEELMLKLGRSSLNAADMVAVLGKTALALRPTLKGLADGTIEFGDALEKDFIKQLDAADDALKSFWEHARIYSARGGIQIKDEIQFIATGVKEMFTGMKGYAGSGFSAVWATMKGDLAEARKHSMEAAVFGKRFFEGAFGDPNARHAGAGIEGRADMALEAKETAAQKKARARTELSLTDFATAGARYGTPATEQGWHGWIGGTMATGTAQALYNAQQARKVQELEAQAREVSLTGISATGESAQDLFSRADDIRQTITGLRDKDREVGKYSAEIDASATGQAVQAIRQAFEADSG